MWSWLTPVLRLAGLLLPETACDEGATSEGGPQICGVDWNLMLKGLEVHLAFSTQVCFKHNILRKSSQRRTLPDRLVDVTVWGDLAMWHKAGISCHVVTCPQHFKLALLKWPFEHCIGGRFRVQDHQDTTTSAILDIEESSIMRLVHCREPHGHTEQPRKTAGSPLWSTPSVMLTSTQGAWALERSSGV